jgi:EAL domain-containing protein (putative c-di-GMP-specific phosphodiesterase class I)
VLQVLIKRSLVTVFQPILSLDHGVAVGVEALSRFAAEPQQGPDRWFADAASVELAAELELLAMRTALMAAEALPKHFYVSLNASPTTLDRPELLDYLAHAPVEPGRIVLEITEHVSIDDYGGLAESIDQLRSLGIRLAVDDAGAGYSSFRHIVQLAPDYIKLDRTLITGMHGDTAKRALSAAVVMFGRDISAEVVAEGIETHEELQTIRELGISAAQGFLFGKPAAHWDIWPTLTESQTGRSQTLTRSGGTQLQA